MRGLLFLGRGRVLRVLRVRAFEGRLCQGDLGARILRGSCRLWGVRLCRGGVLLGRLLVGRRGWRGWIVVVVAEVVGLVGVGVVEMVRRQVGGHLLRGVLRR